VANSTSPRDGRHIDQLGYYDPMTDPATVKIDADKARLWLQRGAQPTDTAAYLLRQHGILPAVPAPAGAAPSKEAAG